MLGADSQGALEFPSKSVFSVSFDKFCKRGIFL